MLVDFYAANVKRGYIAGANDGIVTVQGKPASRTVLLFNAKSLLVERRVNSLDNGHYLFMGLDLSGEYLVLARDYKKEFEPFAWDYVTPANDLTVTQQQELWASWQ